LIFIFLCILSQGSKLDKGASQESSLFDWLLLGERAFGTGL